MRILALRGHNLASLAEPFAIDLEAEPLAGAGLHAAPAVGAHPHAALADPHHGAFHPADRHPEGGGQVFPFFHRVEAAPSIQYCVPQVERSNAFARTHIRPLFCPGD